MIIMFLAALIFIVYLVVKIDELNSRISKVEEWLLKMGHKQGNEQPCVEVKRKEEPVNDTPTLADRIMVEAPSFREEPIRQEAQPEKARVVNEKLKYYEGIFAKYWLGILGALILVVGVSFLGVYTALKCVPFVRFLMILAVSAGLTGLYSYLRSKEVYRDLALWLRSGAGALFLFACLGAGSIGAIRWIYDPYFALAVLLAGIGVNLYLGYIGGGRLYSSVHLVISLAALSVAPQNNIIFISAVIVAIFGAAISFKGRRDYNLAAVISAFFVYHCYWVYDIGRNGLLSGASNFIGIVGVLVVSAAALAVHYREIYKSEKIEELPATVHFLNWMYFGIGIYIHSFEHPIKPFLIMLGAVCAFIIAKKGKKVGVRWVYVMDTLSAQIIALIAILSLAQWEIQWYIIAGIMFLECLAFTLVMIKEGEMRLFNAGLGIAMTIGAVIAIGLLLPYEYAYISSKVEYASVAGLCAIIGSVLYVIFRKKVEESLTSSGGNFNLALFGMLLPFLVYGGYFALKQYVWAIYFASSILLAFIYMRQKYRLEGLTCGLATVLIAASITGWHSIRLIDTLFITEKVLYAFPFIMLSLFAAAFSYVERSKRWLSWFGIYLLVAHIFACSYLIFNSVSTFIPALIWLAVSVLFCELMRYFERSNQQIWLDLKLNKEMFWAGIILLAGFVVRHILTHLQSELYLGFIHTRLAIGSSGIAAMLYWYFRGRPKGYGIGYAEQTVHNLLVEAIMLFSAITIGIEADNRLRPVLWALIALVCLACGIKSSRLKLYSLLFLWLSAFHLAFTSGLYITPSNKWQEEAWAGGIIALLLESVYIFIAYKKDLYSGISFPFLADFFGGITRAIERKKNMWVSYPVFMAAAFFFYFSFDKSILTLLFVVECFGIFLLSIVLKESNFRNIAMAGLVGCLVRLVFYDLAQSSTLARAVVFIVVGCIMLLMNFIYSKYSVRKV